MDKKTLLLLLIPFIVLDLGLKIAALIQLSRAERVRWDNKLLWALIILAVNTFGPVAWFLFGRDERPAA